MILHLYNKEILIQDNVSPERIDNTQVSYIFELGTNHLLPVLTIKGHCYTGNNISVSFDYPDDELHLHVDLLNGNNIIIKSYDSTFKLYRTFTLGNEEHINVYEELIKARAKIKELQEEGDVI